MSKDNSSCEECLKTVADIDTYVTKNASNNASRILLFYTDVYGIHFLNNKILMDYFASKGFLVLAPDFFSGEKLQELQDQPDFDRTKWIPRHFGNVQKVLDAWVPAAKSQFGGAQSQYCSVGYCFGAVPTMIEGNKSETSAVALAHPSRMTEQDFEKVKAPLLICAAEQDRIFPLELRHKAEKILTTKSTPEGAEGNLGDDRVGKGGYKFQVIVYSGVSHGFGPKNPTDEPTLWAKQDSARQIAAWFKRFTRE
ncbi:hypothetical protein PROFUN_10538 [Planoprotostelium fungivorum]|nr:hypothetical protein PROFUN_10538 [Planoprotostelium fungivorum]